MGKKTNLTDKTTPVAIEPQVKFPLTWVRATYQFHTFAYRDPRAAFASAVGIPAVSPTAVLLGIASTLFALGRSQEALEFLAVINKCDAIVDSPEGVVFFRAFHQLRRYESGLMKTKKADFKPNARLGFTNISQGTREYGLIQGGMKIYVGVPAALVESAILALRNRDHFGTRDSLCSLSGEVEVCERPSNIVFLAPEEWQKQLPKETGVTVVTLARFTGRPLQPAVGTHWWMAGGPETELVPYLVKGVYCGTSRGKIYRKMGDMDGM